MELINNILNWLIAYELISMIISAVALGIGMFVEWIKEKGE